MDSPELYAIACITRLHASLAHLSHDASAVMAVPMRPSYQRPTSSPIWAQRPTASGTRRLSCLLAQTAVQMS